MGIGLPRVALWGLVVLMLAGSLASVVGAQAASTPTYTLIGSAEQPNSTPVPAGVTVDLISSGSHSTYTAQTTGNSGTFSFSNSAGGNTGGNLAPGWWGLYVPPQAHVKASGCNPCVILPAQQNPQFSYLSASNLTSISYRASITGVTALPYTQMIHGNVTLASSGKRVAGAAVQLIDPSFENFVIANNTTSSTGYYTLSIPSGNFVLQTIAPGAPNVGTGQGLYNYTPVTPTTTTVDPVLGSYITYGWVNLPGSGIPGVHVPNGGNVTLFDPTTGGILSQPTSGPFFSIGTYPAGYVTGGSQTFDVVVSTVGYQTVWYPLTVSGANPTGGTNPHYVYAAAEAPPAQYLTSLDFSRGFGLVQVTTNVSLQNDSTFPVLPNASVGQLWAQLALDWQGNTTFNAANLPAVLSWLGAQGPFFPAGQDHLTVDSIGFNQTTNYTSTNSTTCTTYCGLSSSASMAIGYGQTYSANGTISTSAKTHTFSFTFRHPTNYQSINYTIDLPAGYVLQAGTPAPAQTRLVAAGPGNTWTSFTLVSMPSASASGTASFTAVKYAGVSPAVNVSVANFAFSSHNVLNDTANNYTVIVGAGENATFSAINSTFPAGTNGTSYAWTFGDSSPVVTRSTPTTWHTYAAAGVEHGLLQVTSSGGTANTTNFTVYVASTPPTASISVNATASETNHTGSGVKYLVVPQGTALHFNATNSSATLPSPPTVVGIISVASWNITAGKNTWLANYSLGSNGQPNTNFSYLLLGAGAYLTSGDINGTSVSFLGWQFNVTLTVWDAAGHTAQTYLDILVKDTEKPVAVPNVLAPNGHTVSSAGVTEAANGTAQVYLWANGSNDPHNGSVVSYRWVVGNPGNYSVNRTINQSAVMPGYKVPAKFPLWLTPQSKPYAVNLTVTDRAGNTAYSVVSLTVAPNTTLRPVLSLTNLTTPTSMTQGSTYTVWVNVTNTVGRNSTAENVTVQFYLLPPSGSGSRILIGGSPNSVQFFNYTNGTGQVESSPIATGEVSVKWNQTVRAQISFTPGRTGTFDLWANATATNEFASDYAAAGNQAHVQVTLNANPTTTYEIYAAIIVAAVVVIGLAIFLWRSGGIRPARSSSKSSTSGRSGLERSSKKDEDDDE